jgi:NitT/TauT family transport system permease protein
MMGADVVGRHSVSPVWPVVAGILMAISLLIDRSLTLLLLVWFSAWALNVWVANNARGSAVYIVVPVFFGVTILILWEMAVWLFDVSPVILPPPSAIATRFATSTDVLWQDLVQTIFKGALSGYAIGCIAAIGTALAIDRSSFLQRGLLPVGNFVAALPIVGTAPIFVMWYGFGWQSKAAVVVVMVFFPMLVNTVQGLKASETMQRDLMRTYAAGYWQTLLKLRLPAALPFIFNGLKISTTLALIGAIVAEFFGSPTVGMGFRIKIEVGRLAMDMVWSEITVAALAGSAFYGAVTYLERRTTFWHPSQRN